MAPGVPWLAKGLKPHAEISTEVLDYKRVVTHRGRTMKLNAALIPAGLLMVCTFHAQHVEARGPSTREERARVIEQARWLEQNPLAQNAPETRRWLQEWIADVPDIRFWVCEDLLGHALNGNYAYSREVNQQVLFSGAALTLDRQDKARDDIAVYTAGVQGALRAYEVLARSKPDAKLAFLDDLVIKRNQGQLAAYVSKEAKERCKRSNITLIAAPAGAVVALLLAGLIAWLGKRRADDVIAPERLTLGNASRRVARTSQTIVLICVAYYLGAAVALHFLEPDYDPRFRFMSEYAWGSYGWLMTTTFFVLGLALVAVAIGLRNLFGSSLGTSIGFGLLIVGALGVSFAGAFREFIPHSVGSAIGLPGIVMAALILSLGFRRTEGWPHIHSVITLSIAFGMLIALLSIIVDVGMPGLQQRVFLGLVLLWLSVVVHQFVRLTRVEAAGIPKHS